MKLSSPTPLAGRDAIREKHRRARASAPTLRARFPQLASLQLDLEFSDRTDFLPSPQVTVFHAAASAFFRFACPYNDCDGEFDLGSAVDLAVSSGEHQSGNQIRCTGARRGGAACTLCLEYSISAQGC